jgi:hypothetical protein
MELITESTSPSQILQIAQERARAEAQALRADIKNLNAPQRVRLGKIGALVSPRPAAAANVGTLLGLAKSLKFLTAEEYAVFAKTAA